MSYQASQRLRVRSVAISMILGVIGLLAMATVASSDNSTAAEGDDTRLRQAAKLRGLAQADMEDGNYGRAQQHLESLASLLPQNVLPPINLAICHLRQNHTDSALEQVRRAQALDPDNPQMLYTLARILEDIPDAEEEWEGVIDHFAESHPRDPRPYYLRAERAAQARNWSMAVEAYRESTRRDAENLVLLTELLVAAAESMDLVGTSDALDGVEDRLNGFEGNMVEFADRLRDSVDAADVEALRPAAMVLRNLLRPTDLYQLGLVPLTGGAQLGGPLFPQLDFDPPLPKSIQGGQDIEISFVDGSGTWTKPEPDNRIASLLLAPNEETVDLMWLAAGNLRRMSVVEEDLPPRSFSIRPMPAGPLIYQDIDQDRISDLAGADTDGNLWFYKGFESGEFDTGVAIFKPADTGSIHSLDPLDIDHDGDLDLFAARAGASDLYLQNNGDGTWSEQAQQLGLAGGSIQTTGIVSADFDDDGDLDLVTIHLGAPPRLYLNRRAGPLVESGQIWGLDQVSYSTRGVVTADFNNDGLFDLLFWGTDGASMLINCGGRFAPMTLAADLATAWQAVALGDVDNDGDQDGLVALVDSSQVLLLRNRRTSFTLEEVGIRSAAITNLVTGDLDADGDLDLALELANGRLQLWRNEGGNRNQWVGLRLQGRHENNSKNNTQGLFTRIEVRIGDAFQALMGNGGINHLGLGAARQADVIRVVWTNGLAQTWLRVAANRTLVEEQVLKGSCPFLYSWNGQGFEFVTDLMWRSPLGMMLPDGSPAPHQSARDYVLIPGERLVPAGDELWIQITEELWEAVYADRLQLIAVDHPETQEMVVDEAFRAPPHPLEPPVHWIERQLSPTAAIDQSGRDVLSLITSRDEQYVDELPLSRFQGLTHGHYLEMTFEQVPDNERLRLLLWGWIFPTDTTINYRMHQNSGLQSLPPSLEILDSSGSWQTLIAFMGFPNGKRKAVVVDLGHRLPSGTVRLRIPTNLQIYWDAATLAVGDPVSPALWRHLDPVAADLHFRGYSRMYRDTASGPHLFDYDRVETTPRFRDLAGDYTRFGPVETLLTESDDRYVIMNAGDEMTVRFDARRLPHLPQGWRRDWILFTDGWVKDGDLHTVHSQTVEPLPYHGMSGYPDVPVHSYPDTDAHREYLENYQTRQVTDAPFRAGLKGSGDEQAEDDPKP